MKFNAAEWQFRLQYMTLKQLLHLCELSRLPDSIGCGEEMVPPLQHPDAESRLTLCHQRPMVQRTNWVEQDDFGAD